MIVGELYLAPQQSVRLDWAENIDLGRACQSLSMIVENGIMGSSRSAKTNIWDNVACWALPAMRYLTFSLLRQRKSNKKKGDFF